MKNITIKYIILAFLFGILASSCSNSKKAHKKVHKRESKTDIQRAKVVNYAKKQLGIKYVYGGSTPKGFDCSGFTQYVFTKYGYSVPRISRQYAKTGTKVSVKNTKPGDVLLFTGSNKRKRVTGHLGIVVSNKNGQIKFIHASSSRGIVISDLKVSYYQDRILGARRIIK